jgi:Cu+-exporting ATPase
MTSPLEEDAMAGTLHEHGNPAQSAAVKDAVLDPVCGMTVDPQTTPHRHSHRGQSYYF